MLTRRQTSWLHRGGGAGGYLGVVLRHEGGAKDRKKLRCQSITRANTGKSVAAVHYFALAGMLFGGMYFQIPSTSQHVIGRRYYRRWYTAPGLDEL